MKEVWLLAETEMECKISYIFLPFIFPFQFFFFFLFRTRFPKTRLCRQLPICPRLRLLLLLSSSRRVRFLHQLDSGQVQYQDNLDCHRMLSPLRSCSTPPVLLLSLHQSDLDLHHPHLVPLPSPLLCGRIEPSPQPSCGSWNIPLSWKHRETEIHINTFSCTWAHLTPALTTQSWNQ